MLAQLFGAVEAFDVNFEESFESFEWEAGLRLVVVEEVEVIAEEVEELFFFVRPLELHFCVARRAARPLTNRNFPNGFAPGV